MGPEDSAGIPGGAGGGATPPNAAAHELVENIFRREAGRMTATLVRILGPRHLDLIEEVVQDALLSALRDWPFHGVPRNPTAWLIQVAKNRALDRLRRDATFLEKQARLATWLPREEPAPGERDLPGDLPDDVLTLVFMACHPALAAESRVALTLKSVCGFSVREIARAFLVPEPTVAQRLVRAKQRLREEAVVFERPRGHELSRRLDSVLDVLYSVFNEGHLAHEGESLVRADLCEEATRLARLLARHGETAAPKTHALLALFLLTSARLPARVDGDGAPVLLAQQDRSRWDARLLAEGLRHLSLAAAGDELTAYHLEAGIAAAHTLAPSGAETDWAHVVDLYDQLLALNPSPVVAISRAAALARWKGPAEGLAALAEVESHPALRAYTLLPGVKAELLRELGRAGEAAGEYRRALALPAPEPQRRWMERRLAEVEGA